MPNEFVARNGLIAQNNSTITGSLNVTAGITGSLLGTSSFASTASYITASAITGTVTSASYALTASYAMNAGSTFPYTGSAGISGSLSINNSNTDAANTNGANSHILLNNLYGAGSNTVISFVNNQGNVGKIRSGEGTGMSYVSSGSNAFHGFYLGGDASTGGTGILWVRNNNVGIGVSNPSTYRLDVSGSVRLALGASGMIVTGLNNSTQSNIVSIDTSTGQLYYQNTIPTASYAATSSYANNFTVANTLTAQTLVVQTITSSIDFITGSSRFGSLISNTHQFTGSVGITGSLTLTGSFTQNASTASFNGLVGIGTTTPASKLHVSGTTTINGAWNGNFTNGLHLAFTPNTGSIYSLQNGAAWRRLDIDGDPIVLGFNSGGKVGIGTNSPQTPLDIVGGDGPRLLVYGTGGTPQYIAGIGVNLGQASNSQGFFVGQNSAFSIDQATAFENYPYPSGYTTRFVVAVGGNVGIGTVSPTYKLDVSGDINYSGEIRQNGVVGIPHTASVGLSLSAASFAATTEGIYTIDGGDPTTYDFTFPDPTLVPHRKIIIANKSETTRVAINATNQPYYQGTRSTYTKNVDSIPAVSTMEFVSDGTVWRSLPSSVTPTYNSVDLSGGNYDVYTLGIYRITNASTNTINLPDPLQHEGGRITIINSDGTNAATFGGTYTPVDAGDNAVTDVPLDTASEFVSINGYWYKV